MSKSILISASDTLFFRDGRSFTMGEDTFAQGFFPPLPSVLFGSLCTASMNTHSAPWETLQINNIYLSENNGQVFFPLPKDMIVPKKKDTTSDYYASLLECNKSSSASNAKSVKTLEYSKNTKLENEPFLIENIELKKYLNKSRTSYDTTPLSKYITKEPKIGIGRNKHTHSVQEGLIYRIEMQRLENRNKNILSIGVDFNGLDNVNLNNKPAQLGGEKKVVWVRDNERSPRINCPELEGNQFKIYLSTPAIFKSGWKPNELFEKYNLNLITAALDKPLNVGGWDIDAKQPKPMLQAIPAGAVYYLEAESKEAAQNAAKKIHGTAISDYSFISKNNIEFNSARQGFGIAFIGKI